MKLFQVDPYFLAPYTREAGKLSLISSGGLRGGRCRDGELATPLERVAEGDRVAFRNLYQAVGPKLFSICKRLMRDQSAAEDALQDVMVRIWEKSPFFDRTKGDAMGWMARAGAQCDFQPAGGKACRRAVAER